MSSDLKTSFELEPNPFERSFANKEPNDSSLLAPKNPSTDLTSTSSSAKANNKHNLHIPNLSTLTHQPHTKLPGITPPLFTPSGRRLPPLGLSPGSHLTNPETPGSNLWNSLISATNNPSSRNNTNNGTQPANPEGDAEASAHPFSSNQNNGFNQFVNSIRKTGLTPNESNLRSGLTPGVINHSSFPFNSVPGLTTPGALLNSPMTPGLLSLLGMTNTGQSMPLANNNLQQKPQQPNPQLRQEQRGPNVHEEQQPLPQSMQINQPHYDQNNVVPPQALTTENHVGGFAMPKIREAEDTSTSPASQSSKRSAESGERENKKQKTEPKKRATGKKVTTKVKKDPEATNNGKVESDSPDGGPSSLADKRKSFLERNRVAASKCRQRKKQLIQKMEDELSFYSTGYRELSAQVSQLRDQVITLKGVLVSHKDCSMLAQSVGGFEALNMIIQQANYATQVTASSQSNVTSIPSTIPTTLNNPREPVRQAPSAQYQIPPPAPTAAVGPGLPMNINGQAPAQLQQLPASKDVSNTTSNSTTVNMPHAQMNMGGQGVIDIPSHHSVTDLPASVANNAAMMANNYASGDLRAINSMSNLAGMNQPQRKQGPVDNGLRPVNSMVDLQLHQFQQNVPQTGFSGLIAQSQE
ncbi:uncharacterized protein CANTADRAFT_20349 [Suhomyces tanzawaensis NRRL Y-17324]|uniref:BZIP domain-containing protein n=1 Tax=Suhomyces tanzawaensis NRRL Y-17324 TaxID=984487 RepID=A0A1E4SMR3_9ASCO|nr:uncharacterized protein CANTADRAFT_20349 [Suhomyces tanzawaensis NRRL Y-17324]ODV80785.1 hypothetical protein CANTADRAFT_20349 [Suhomyces tanzawaensis NRRL Y-17324]